MMNGYEVSRAMNSTVQLYDAKIGKAADRVRSSRATLGTVTYDEHFALLCDHMNLKRECQASVARLLLLDKPSVLAIRLGDAISHAQKLVIEAEIDIFRRWIAPGILDAVALCIISDRDRMPGFIATKDRGDIINLRSLPPKGFVIGELGRWLEHSGKEVRATAIRFYENRETRYHEEQLRYTKGGVRTQSNADTAEVSIVAVGLRRLYADPVGLAAIDPELFAFTVNVLRGLPTN